MRVFCFWFVFSCTENLYRYLSKNSIKTVKLICFVPKNVNYFCDNLVIIIND